MQEDRPVEVEAPPDVPKHDGRAIAVPIAVRDILPWTKESCTQCLGRGVITSVLTSKMEIQEIDRGHGTKAARRVQVTVPKLDRKRKTKLCGCAIKRFRKVQGCTVVNGQLFAVEPWVAVHPETIAEAIEAMEKEQAAKAPLDADPPSGLETTT